jgi:polyhydroxyalkanoate synthesis regulator phasin
MTQNEQEPSRTGKSNQGGLYDITRKVLLAAVGATALTYDEIVEFVNRLAERGELAEQEAKTLLQNLVNRREQDEDDDESYPDRETMAGMMAQMEFMSQQMAALNKRLDQEKPESEENQDK